MEESNWKAVQSPTTETLSEKHLIFLMKSSSNTFLLIQECKRSSSQQTLNSLRKTGNETRTNLPDYHPIIFFYLYLPMNDRISTSQYQRIYISRSALHHHESSFIHLPIPHPSFLLLLLSLCI